MFSSNSDSETDSAHTLYVTECAETYLNEYHLPMLVYVQDEENTKHYATIKKNYAIRGWPGTKDETLPEFVARVHLLDDLPSLKDALRELTIAEGACAHTSLWTMWRKLPGYMDKAGVAYLPEQEACREYFEETSLNSGLPCIVDGFPEDPIVYEDNRLFRLGERNCLTPQDAVYYVTARSISFEEALAVLVVQCPGKVGHDRSLYEIFDSYSVEEQVAVGRLTSDELEEQPKERVIYKVQYYLKRIESEPTRKERADTATSLFLYLLETEVAWFIRKYDKFRQVVLEKCEEFTREEGAEFPALKAVCADVMRSFGDASFPFSGETSGALPRFCGDETSGALPRFCGDETSGALPRFCGDETSGASV